jgi:hypothetical protein
MMDVFFADLVKFSAANLQIRTNTAVAKAVISSEQYLVGQSVLIYIALYNLKQILIASGKT